MIITLRNNKKLLGKNRPHYFLRQLDFNELIEKFHISLPPISKTKDLSEEEKRSISRKYKRAKRKEKFLFIFLIALVTPLVFEGLYSILSYSQNYNYVISESRMKEASIESGDHANDYKHFMESGYAYLRDREWFYAAGNFKRATTIIPLDSEAEYYIAKSYCYLCITETRACQEADQLVEKLNQKYPDNLKAVKLKNYIKRKKEKLRKLNLEF